MLFEAAYFICRSLASQQPVHSHKLPNVCGPLSWAWLCPRKSKLYSKAVFYQHKIQLLVSKCLKAPQIHFCLPSLAGQLLGLDTEKT